MNHVSQNNKLFYRYFRKENLVSENFTSQLLISLFIHYFIIIDKVVAKNQNIEEIQNQLINLVTFFIHEFKYKNLYKVKLFFYLYSFIMDWQDKKQNYNKQPPDKKNKPKYISKEEAQSQRSQNTVHKQAVEEKHERKYDNNNQNNNNRRQQPRQKQEFLERPKFIEKNSSVDGGLSCLICSQFIKKKQSTWTCQYCCISLHLKCIKQWIKRMNEDNFQENNRKFLYKWTCIQCKAEFNQNIPEYYCFCGKFKNPQPDRDLEPHSCGKPCQRKRGAYCTHLCPQLCHSGKCKPCEYEGSVIKCNCGKTQRMVRCSEERAVFQCGKKCEKILKCQKHKCERNCHYGECYPCKKKHLVTCYCGKNQDVVDCIEKNFACQSICEKLLNCGFHKCEKDCHQGPCGPCLKAPQYQKTCNCGRYQLMMISQIDRQSCKDPIPSCGMPCKKKLPCGHQCPQICHEGRCADCKVSVQQLCRCGSTQRKIQCYKTRHTKQQFHCQTICKKKKSCGIHICNTECCKFKNLIGLQGHQCELTCQKMLNCEKHTCDLPCHGGLCKKCPVIYSQAQPCPCGATSLKPPIICGTLTPQCDNFCKKQMACGHKCVNLCHYGGCRCRQEIEVTCRCGNSRIKTTCGRQALCLTKCQKYLECGHKCLVQCHSGTCKEANKDGCFKKCDKDRLDCGHRCKQICHYGKKCEQYPCQAQILIKCQCGNRQTSVICGSQGTNITEGLQKKKHILCNKKCQNKKRFEFFYKDKEIYYPNSLMQYGFKNFNYLQKLEQRLQKFISESDAFFIEVQFKAIGDHISKSALLNLFENHYHLNTHFYRHMKTASFTLTQTQNTMIPKPCLSEYIKQVAKGYIKRTNLPFEYTIKFDGENKQKSEVVLRSLKPYIHKYYVERKDKIISVHFWNKQEGLQAKQFLQSQHVTVYFSGEENLGKMEEEQKIQLNQIIETETEVKEQQSKKLQKTPGEEGAEKQQTKVEQSQIKKQNEKIKQQQNKDVKQEQQKQELNQNKQQKQQKQQKQDKSKQTEKNQGSKIIFRKGAPNFIRSQYPPSSQNVQDIYVIDEQQLFHKKVDWDAIVKELLQKRMGIQASEWRLRALIMINNHHKLDQKIFTAQFNRIIDMYQKDKEKARRILEIQKLDVKKIQEQMKGNQIYLSDHEPQIMSYCILHNYYALDKIQFTLSDQCTQTREVQRSLQIIQNVQKCNFEEFYTQFKNGDYILACQMIQFVHQIRENLLKILENKKKAPVKDLYKYLLFNSEERLIEYFKQNGLSIGKRMSKSKKIEEYTHLQGELSAEKYRDEEFLSFVNQKRDKSYFLEQPQELVDDKWVTKSFFAFGDFKESKNPKYMIALCKALRDGK